MARDGRPKRKPDRGPAEYREGGKGDSVILTRAYVSRSKRYPIKASHLSRLAESRELPARKFWVPSGHLGKGGIREQLVFEWKPLEWYRKHHERAEGPTL